MKVWQRAPISGECCGYCGNPIPVGEPELVYAHARVRHIRRRCETCAGEPVPADLPPLEPTPERQIGTPEPLRRIVSRVVDYKHRQVGDDE